MGLFDNPLGTLAKVGLAPVTGGASLFEPVAARIPVLNSLTGAQTEAQKQLIQKQEQLAADAKQRAQQNQQARMQALGQSLLAFNPQNQMMAQMFGPQAAFSPQQFAQMGGDPSVSGMPWGTGTDAQRQAQVANRDRQQRIGAQMQPVGPGPAPLRMPAPQQARRF